MPRGQESRPDSTSINGRFAPQARSGRDQRRDTRWLNRPVRSALREASSHIRAHRRLLRPGTASEKPLTRKRHFIPSDRDFRRSEMAISACSLERASQMLTTALYLVVAELTPVKNIAA
jgi:hypothetical protein